VGDTVEEQFGATSHEPELRVPPLEIGLGFKFPRPGPDEDVVEHRARETTASLRRCGYHSADRCHIVAGNQPHVAENLVVAFEPYVLADRVETIKLWVQAALFDHKDIDTQTYDVMQFADSEITERCRSDTAIDHDNKVSNAPPTRVSTTANDVMMVTQ